MRITVIGAGVVASLVVAALVGAYSLHGTTVPKAICLLWSPQSRSPAEFWPDGPASPTTVAQAAVSDIRRLCRLTFEEVAPLLGVSRRTLHSWANGSPISARRERRLRTLSETIHTIVRFRPGNVRDFLLNRGGGGVRPYDLLAEGLYQEAVDAVSGRRAAVSTPGRPELETIDAQLNRLDSAVSMKPGRPRPELSGRIR